MQLRRRWQACGWLLVSLGLVSMAMFTGCEKAGDGGGGAPLQHHPLAPPRRPRRPPRLLQLAWPLSILEASR